MKRFRGMAWPVAGMVAMLVLGATPAVADPAPDAHAIWSMLTQAQQLTDDTIHAKGGTVTTTVGGKGGSSSTVASLPGGRWIWRVADSGYGQDTDTAPEGEWTRVEGSTRITYSPLRAIPNRKAYPALRGVRWETSTVIADPPGSAQPPAAATDSTVIPTVSTDPATGLQTVTWTWTGPGGTRLQEGVALASTPAGPVVSARWSQDISTPEGLPAYSARTEYTLGDPRMRPPRTFSASLPEKAIDSLAAAASQTAALSSTLPDCPVQWTDAAPDYDTRAELLSDLQDVGCKSAWFVDIVFTPTADGIQYVDVNPYLGRRTTWRVTVKPDKAITLTKSVKKIPVTPLKKG